MVLNIQFFGGRGASAGTGSGKEVDIDKWGKFINRYEATLIKDKDGTVIGRIYDDIRYEQEEDIRKITKKAILEDVDAWRMDDGTYGDEDTHIGIAYADGTHVNLNDLDGKPYKKKDIIGVHISTGDYESVWGGEYNPRTRQIEPYKTWSEDGESGQSNVYSGYKATAEYYVRIQETDVKKHSKYRGDYWEKERKILRRSKKRKI